LCGGLRPGEAAGRQHGFELEPLLFAALCPARISASSSLPMATMNQKSSLREVPQFVSRALTANNDLIV
jgi:hypothetical protein